MTATTPAAAARLAVDGDVGVGRGVLGKAVRRQLRTGVEAEPAAPQKACAGHGPGEVMRCHIGLAEALARPEDQGGDETGHASIDVNDRAAGKIEHAGFGQETAAPDPVGHRRIDEERPQAHEPQHGRELHALGKGTGDQGRGDDGEGHLEHREDIFGNRARNAVDRYAVVHELAESAHEGIEWAAIGEGNRVSDDEPDHGHQCRDGEALHDGGQHVLAAHHAAIEQGQTGNGHHQHQSGGGQHPRRIAGRDRRLRFLCKRRQSLQRGQCGQRSRKAEFTYVHLLILQ